MRGLNQNNNQTQKTNLNFISPRQNFKHYLLAYLYVKIILIKLPPTLSPEFSNKKFQLIIFNLLLIYRELLN